MGTIGYYLSLPLLYLVSLLPAPLLYSLSDLLFLITYHVAGYRRIVVRENLQKSFPEKSEEELKKIEEKFYRYLCDLTLETFKTLTMNRRFVMEHCKFSEQAKHLFNEYYGKKQNLIIVIGHWGNWEWAGHSFSISCRQQLYVIYRTLKNKHYDRLLAKMRSRFGTGLIEMNNTLKEMISKRNEINATVFLADQTPPPENAYWTKFLNQDTPVFKGTEVIAGKLNYPVVFAGVRRISRGYYEIFAETLFENPATASEGEITKAHTRRLEETIQEQPEIWLWSHRRWKHKRPQPFEKM